MDAKLEVALANLHKCVKGKQRGVIKVLQEPPTMDALRELFDGDVPAEIAEALQDAKPQYVDQRAHCEVLAQDILAVAIALPKRCKVCLALIKGCAAGRFDRKVTIQADDLYTLLAAAEKAGLRPPADKAPEAAHAAVNHEDLADN